jgi:surfactin family lipopeptide synthetase A
VQAPRGTLSAELRADIASHKAEIRALLLSTEGQGVGRPRAPAESIPRRSREGPLPLSFAQERMWFLEQLEPGTARYNVPAAFDVRGALSVEALGRALEAVVRRHEILRTAYRAEDGRPVQIVETEARWRHRFEDVSERSDEARAERVRALADAHAREPFDLREPEVLRTTVVRLAPDRHVLLVCLHHIASDGWSVAVLLREVLATYHATVLGRTSPLPELPIQYADYASWQREWLAGDVLEQEVRYWVPRLAGASALELPTDRPRPPAKTYRGLRHRFTVPAPLTAELGELGRANGATLFMTLLAAFCLLLHRYSGQDDICVGTPIANRARLETERLIGFFVNTLVIRIDLSPPLTFAALLARTRDAAIGAYEHQDVPFERLVRKLALERSASRHPLFDVMFLLDELAPPEAAPATDDFTLTPLPTETGTAKFDLTLSMRATPSGLDAEIEYDVDLFDAATVEGIAAHFEALLYAIVAAPRVSIGLLPALTAAERALVAEVNATSVDEGPAPFLHEAFEEHARQAPDAVAVVFEGESLTYAELDARAGELAGELRVAGVGPEVLVGLSVERSLEVVVGVLAILKAGGAYLPLDPSLPRDRIAFMLKDAHITLVLTQERLRVRLAEHGVRTWILDGPRAEEGRPLRARARLTPDNLAYAIYTSGSTGAPKGVMLHHRGLANLCRGQVSALGVRKGDRVLQFAPIGFDASVSEIGMALTSGATLVMMGERTLESIDVLDEWLVAQGITVATFPPSLLAVLRGSLPELRTLLTAGERCGAEIVARWGKDRSFVNAYGPTEITVCATMHPCDATSTAAPPIGRPIQKALVYVLGEELAPAPIGAVGELFVGGAGVARGYLGRGPLTAGRFLPDPFSPERGARMYRTGDLVRWRASTAGRLELEYVGRADDQVKMRGFRIELGEIEATLAEHRGVSACAVLLRGHPPHDKLVAFSSPSEADGGARVSDLREHLVRRLPGYMVPSAFVQLRSMPVTASGKIDRKALAAIDPGGTEPRSGSAQPRSAVEERLAEIYGLVLGLERVGVHDDFFALGGHSLLAVVLMSRIESAFGQPVPVRVLYENRTVAGLAAAMGHAAEGPRLGYMVPLRPGGAKPPLFLIHAVGGSAHSYRELTRHLAPDQPVHALQAAAFAGQPGGASVEEMASRYLAEIRAVRRRGPYRIGGWSMGGLVAWEIARQLRGSADEADRLILIDTHCSPAIAMVGKGADEDAIVQAAFTQHLERSGLRADLQDDLPEDVRRAYRDNFLATLRYQPAPSAQRILLIRAAADDRRVDVAQWKRLTGDRVEIQDVPTDHWGVVAEPYVSLVARAVECFLTEGTVAETVPPPPGR